MSGLIRNCHLQASIAKLLRGELWNLISQANPDDLPSLEIMQSIYSDSEVQVHSKSSKVLEKPTHLLTI